MDPRIPPDPAEMPGPTRRPRPRHRWAFEGLEDRTLMATGPAVATPADLAGASTLVGATSGSIAPGQSYFFRVDGSTGEMLVARVHAEGARTRLSLLDGRGDLITQSDGLSAANRDDLITQGLVRGTYYLEVTGTGGVGLFALAAQKASSAAPGSTIDLGGLAITSIVTGDFNGDGRPDVAAGYRTFDPSTGAAVAGGVSVLLGNGDGTFQAPINTPVGAPISALAAGNFDGDGALDLAVGTPAGVSVLPGQGNGSFGLPIDYAAGGPVSSLVTGDFNGDGTVDLAAGYGPYGAGSSYYGSAQPGGVSVLLGDGFGTFQAPINHPVGGPVTSLAAGDFNGDGNLDLAAGYETVDPATSTPLNVVSVLPGDGGGSFGFPAPYQVGSPVTSLAAGDLNGDGRPDLVAGTFAGVSVLKNAGDGSFQAALDYASGGEVTSVAVGSFVGDGSVDLAAGYETFDPNTGAIGGGVSVLQGRGDGTFPAPVNHASVGGVTAVAMGDFTGIGRPSVSAGYESVDPTSGTRVGGGVSVLPGGGAAPAPVAGSSRGEVTSLAMGDFNGDGQADLVAGTFGGVSVLLASGGAFATPTVYAAGGEVTSLAVGDFNGDGILDLAAGYETFDPNTGDPVGGGVSVLLGDGFGTFQAPINHPVGGPVTSLAAGGFGGADSLDLAAGYETIDRKTGLAVGGGVSILLGDGFGTFQAPIDVPVWKPVTSLVAGDFNGDGILELAAGYETLDPATSTPSAGGVSLLLRDLFGTFQAPVSYDAGGPVTSLAVGDFLRTGRLDLAAGYEAFAPGTGVPVGGGVSVFLGIGFGTFRGPSNDPVGSPVTSLAVGDFNGDGLPDLAAGAAGGVSVLLGGGDGVFRRPVAYAARDVNDVLGPGFDGAGQAEVAFFSKASGQPSILLDILRGGSSGANPASATVRDNPVLADLNGDGTEDLTVVDRSGSILWRRGVPGQPGSYEPPVVVNPPTAPSSGTAIVTAGGRALIASVDDADGVVIFYAYRDGSFAEIARLATGPSPSQVIAADLQGAGVADLVVRNAGDGTASVFLGDGHGGFRVAPLLFLGPGALEIAAADLSGSGRDDLVVTDQATGEVRVFPNLLRAASGPAFGPPSIYQAGGGPYGVAIAADGSTGLTSREATSGVAAGPFTPGGPEGLAVVDPGTNTLAVLDGLGGGALANARALPTLVPGSIVRAADLRGDGITDLVVLGPSTVYVYLGDGHGGFSGTPTGYDVGPDANGLTIADVFGDGKPDLLVGNGFGDVLLLRGVGDGTFRPSGDPRAVKQALDLEIQGRDHVYFADPALNGVVAQSAQAASTILALRQGLLSPQAVAEANVAIGGVTTPYLIVANSGDNNAQVYPILPDGGLGPALGGGRGFSTGDDPVSVTVADLTGDGLPDLIVADKGSNDVAILIAQVQGGTLTFVPGPRLKAGFGPVATAVEPAAPGGYPSLLVSDSRSNLVLRLPGLGGGFFDDQAAVPQLIPVGLPGFNSGPLFVGDFTGSPGGLGLVSLDPGSGSLSFVPDFQSGGRFQMIPLGNAVVVARTVQDEVSLVVIAEGGVVLAMFAGRPDAPGFPISGFSTPDPVAETIYALGGTLVPFVAAPGLGEPDLTPQLLPLDLLGGLLGPVEITPPRPSPMLESLVAHLQPQGESALAIVATLLTVTTELAGAEVAGAPVVEATAEATQGASGGLPNQPAPSNPGVPLREGEGVPEGPDGEGSPTPPAQATLAPLARLLFRLDEAIEKARRAARESLTPPDRPTGAAERSLRALDAVLARWSPALAAGGPAPALLGGLSRVGGPVARAIESALGRPPTPPPDPPPTRPDTPLGEVPSGPIGQVPAPAGAVALTLAGLARVLVDGPRRRSRLPASARSPGWPGDGPFKRPG